MSTVVLSSVVTVAAGQAAPKQKYFSDAGTPFIRAGSLEGLLLSDDAEACEKLSVDSAKQNGMKLFTKGAILFAKSGMSATMGRVYQLPCDAYVVSHLAVLTPSCEVDARYLMYWLRKNSPSRLINDPAYPSIRLEDISNLKFPLPPLKEQRRIAAILDKADAIRKKRAEALTLLDTFLRATFLDMFGDPVTNPKGWEVRPFGALLDIPLRNGISPSSNGTIKASVLTLSAITRQSFDGSHAKEGMFEREVAKSDQVSSDDFYICRGNGNANLVGKGYFADVSMPGTAFPDTMIAARPKIDELSKAFLEMIWNSSSVREQIVKSARTTNGTYKINQRATEQIRIICPPMSEQGEFAGVSARTHETRTTLVTQLNESNNLFSSLSQQAFRGEL